MDEFTTRKMTAWPLLALAVGMLLRRDRREIRTTYPKGKKPFFGKPPYRSVQVTDEVESRRRLMFRRLIALGRLLRGIRWPEGWLVSRRFQLTLRWGVLFGIAAAITHGVLARYGVDVSPYHHIPFTAVTIPWPRWLADVVGLTFWVGVFVLIVQSKYFDDTSLFGENRCSTALEVSLFLIMLFGWLFGIGLGFYYGFDVGPAFAMLSTAIVWSPIALIIVLVAYSIPLFWSFGRFMTMPQTKKAD